MKRFLSWLSAAIIRLVGSTLRMTLDDRGGILNQPHHPPVIIAFWHHQTAIMAYFHWYYCRQRTALTFISRSRDGQFMTDVAARFRIKAIRGSSSKHGAAAALAAVRASTNPQVDIVITPDGPRGPRQTLQPGVIRLAQATGRPIVAVRYQLDWKHELPSWDRFHVAIPFSRCRLITEPPIYVPETATEQELAAISEKVKQALGGD